MWIALTVTSAALQAIGLAIKKHTLRVGGVNDIVAFFVFAFASVLLITISFITFGTLMPESVINSQVWWGSLFSAITTVAATIFSYRAVDMADLSYLSPYSVFSIVFSTLGAVIILHESPTVTDILGMSIIIVGAIVMEYRRRESISRKDRSRIVKNRSALLYFFVAIVLYGISPIGQKVAINASNPLFAATIIHVFVAVAFFIIVFMRSGFARLTRVRSVMTMRHFIMWVAVAGAITVMSNSMMYFALQDGTVTVVMALRRTMPIFAFFIGVYVFGERAHARRRFVATVIMIVGMVLIIAFK